MSNETYICPICGTKMCWTGDVSQNPNEKRWCSVVYHYQCRNVDCRHKSTYEELDQFETRNFLEDLRLEQQEQM